MMPSDVFFAVLRSFQIFSDLCFGAGTSWSAEASRGSFVVAAALGSGFPRPRRARSWHGRLGSGRKHLQYLAFVILSHMLSLKLSLYCHFAISWNLSLLIFTYSILFYLFCAVKIISWDFSYIRWHHPTEFESEQSSRTISWAFHGNECNDYGLGAEVQGSSWIMGSLTGMESHLKNQTPVTQKKNIKGAAVRVHPGTSKV